MGKLEYLYELAMGGSWHGKLAEMELENILGKDWEDKIEELVNE